ncbi:MAG TPA: TlpA disulfide reductase family protein [Kofleriaceae bacterium]|nr:TlpA disulfide reductase family protein [Kofleriaceae bacterium]
MLQLEPGAAEEELPFFLYLPRSNDEQALLLNDRESVRLAHRWQGRRVELSLVDYDWQVEAEVGDDEVLRGELRLNHPIYRQDVEEAETHFATPLRAHRVDRPAPEARFDLAGPASAADLTGTWRIVPDEAVDYSPTRNPIYKAILTQEGGVVRGDVVLDTGDLRFMAGNVRGARMAMGTLDGSHYALLNATLIGPDRMSGELVVLRKRTRFVAERRKGGELPFNDIQPLLVGLDLDAWRSIPAIEAARRRGKPVIVEVFGTWCSNCNDAVVLLRELYERHHAEGLELLGVSLEQTDRPAEAARLVDRFVRRHRVPWTIVTITREDEVRAVMQPFRGATAVPITVFLRRDGSAEAAHVGFIGPTGGDDHVALRAEFDRLAGAILASRSPGPVR